MQARQLTVMLPGSVVCVPVLSEIDIYKHQEYHGAHPDAAR